MKARKLEVLANCLIVFTCLAILGVQGWKYLDAKQEAKRGLVAGDILSVPGVAWNAKKLTVVLALQTTCHFCSESAPFYRRLASEISGKPGIGMVAVFPQSVDEGQRYLSGLQIPPTTQVAQGNLRAQGTPTVAIVDSSGKIRQSWLGKLRPSAEQEVLLALKGD